MRRQDAEGEGASVTEQLHERVGFDYVAAMRRLLTVFTYSEIASRVGYNSVGSVSAVADGRVPSHVHGEAIWAMYVDKFGEKPEWPYRKVEPIKLAKK